MLLVIDYQSENVIVVKLTSPCVYMLFSLTDYCSVITGAGLIQDVTTNDKSSSAFQCTSWVLI